MTRDHAALEARLAGRFAFENQELDTRSPEEYLRDYLQQQGLGPDEIEAALAAQRGGGQPREESDEPQGR